MNNYDDMNQKSNMIIYTTEDGLTKIETTFDEDTVWLSIDQMAELFQRDKSTISLGVTNMVFKFGDNNSRINSYFSASFRFPRECPIVLRSLS